jgi:hypothetical protein
LHLTPEFESFVEAAARRITDRGLGGISELRRDGEVVVSTFTVFAEKVNYAYLVGVRQEARQRYQWSALGIYDDLNLALSTNSEYVSLGESGEEYKQKWPHDTVPYYHVVLGQGAVSWRLYLLYASLHVMVTRYLEADNTSMFIKKALEWLRNR